MVRPRFDAARDFVAARAFIWKGEEIATGQPFPKEGLPTRNVQMLYDARKLTFAPERSGEDDDSAVTMTKLKGGYFEIDAPWLDEPIKARGKAAAEKLLAETREAGEPAHHHGVGITDTGNGWYDVKADWQDEATKAHGREEADRIAAELRDQGPPEGWTPPTE